jgi:hypothetical protein
MSSYEDENRQALKAEIDSGRLQEAGAAHDVFKLLTKNYPRSGSKIDWKRVPGSIEYCEEDRSQERTRFVARFGLNGLVLYIGDGLTDFALAASVADMRQALPVLFEVPQHHYFVGPNASWCMCVTMEGDMAFGWAAVPPLH